MRDEARYRYLSSSSDWTRELGIVFLGGFLLATLLWVGIWYWQARPAQAGALQEKESAVQELEARLAACVAERERAIESHRSLEAEVAQLDRQLKRAWAQTSNCPR